MNTIRSAAAILSNRSRDPLLALIDAVYLAVIQQGSILRR